METLQQFASVPSDLKRLDQWVCWKYVERNGRRTKMPLQTNGAAASSTNPATWNSFEAVAASGTGDGIGFVLTPESGIVAFDFDKCLGEWGAPENWAAEAIAEIDSYTEISPSGLGVRILARGTLDPKGPNRSGRVEIYNKERFVTVTGHTDLFIGGQLLIREVDGQEWQRRLPKLDPAPRVPTSGANVVPRENDPSREDYRIIGKIRRENPEADAAAVERIFRDSYPDQYRQQNRKHGDRKGETYIGYCIRRQMEQDAAKATVEPDILARPDMPESVLDGHLGDIYRKRLADLPIAYAWPALLTCAGAMIPGGDGALRTNLFAALVGDVGTGKTTAIERARQVLGLAEPVWCPLKAGSAEGLALELGDAHGDPRVIFPDELGHLLDKAKIEGASFPRVLNSLYYDNGSRLVIARGKSLRFDTRLSIIGGVVEDDFANVFSASTVHGLYSRTIFGLCPTPYTFLWRPFSGQAEKTSPRRVNVNPDVWTARDSWVKDRKIHPRDAEHALRAAYIAACFDGRELQATDLGAALAFAEYQTRFRMAFSPSQGLTIDAQCGNRIMRALESTGESWVTLRWLQQRTNASRDFGATVFGRCLQSLAMTGELELDFSGRSKKARLAQV